MIQLPFNDMKPAPLARNLLEQSWIWIFEKKKYLTEKKLKFKILKSICVRMFTASLRRF